MSTLRLTSRYIFDTMESLIYPYVGIDLNREELYSVVSLKLQYGIQLEALELDYPYACLNGCFVYQANPDEEHYHIRTLFDSKKWDETGRFTLNHNKQKIKLPDNLIQMICFINEHGIGSNMYVASDY